MLLIIMLFCGSADSVGSFRSGTPAKTANRVQIDCASRHCQLHSTPALKEAIELRNRHFYEISPQRAAKSTIIIWTTE
ncbi:unnamed protein product [Caenorhabditis auriculariae]|uniref:Secreted protein n=1 Tax=Caenorhabditis auriculariae TaxID=2777116 RepID=A0A8S1GPR4_9PELO|nr:unnamed protein product [Caenorhabditis auriculariae]